MHSSSTLPPPTAPQGVPHETLEGNRRRRWTSASPRRTPTSKIKRHSARCMGASHVLCDLRWQFGLQYLDVMTGVISNSVLVHALLSSSTAGSPAYLQRYRMQRGMYVPLQLTSDRCEGCIPSPHQTSGWWHLSATTDKIKIKTVSPMICADARTRAPIKAQNRDQRWTGYRIKRRYNTSFGGSVCLYRTSFCIYRNLQSVLPQQEVPSDKGTRTLCIRHLPEVPVHPT